MRKAPQVRLHWEQRRQLNSLAHARSGTGRVAVRAEIVLRAASGISNEEIAQALGKSPGTVALWRRRFLSHGVAGLTKEAPRPGRPPLVSSTTIESVLRTPGDRPSPSGGKWSSRSVAREVGISKSTVQRIWKAHGLSHRKLSNPPRRDSGMGFLDKVTDFVGLYSNPSERAMALATDERLPVASPLPSDPGPTPVTRPRDRAAEFRAFLQIMDRETPRILDVHLLVDSRLGPLPPEVDRWVSHHPRFHLHSLPRDRVGMSLIDGLIDAFSRRRDRPGASESAHRLKYALREHVRQPEESDRAFVWTATSGEIRGAYGRRAIQSETSGTS
ncbi:MAG TPA: helix-turn-helix domain-containing protein [Thermoplasmata archaeon]|nr:helix-turn-helix domain-containing protein [Thermoplasmata archaeon]